MSSFSSSEAHPELDDVFHDLGAPTAEFKPATSNILAWLIVYGFLLLVGVAALGGGITWAALHGFDLPAVGAAKNQPDWSKVGLLLLAGFSLSVTGGTMVPIKWRELSSRILVCPGGFVKAGRKIEVFRWDDIDRVIQDYVDPKKHTATEGPPMTASTTFLIKFQDGSEFGFYRDSLQSHRQFARLLYAAAQARGIPWEFYRPR